MGSCMSKDKTNNIINHKMAAAELEEEQTKKMLFLGPGDSGKSTILKQLQWLHSDGFTQEDAQRLKTDIFQQIVSQMKNVIEYYERTEERTNNNDDVELQNAITIVKDDAQSLVWTLPEPLADAIQYIWNNDAKIKNVFTDYAVFTHNILDESTEHFWNDLDRIKASNYVPNEDDILNVRCKTTGAVQKEFTIKNTIFAVYDVGGQKSERRKWLHFFNGVQVVLFVVSLSCYDQTMLQDASTNCMVDSLQLFESIVNNRYFVSTHIILFLNKMDLFEKKIRKVPLTVSPAFDDYNEYNHGSDPDPHDFEQTTTYIRDKFHAMHRMKKKKIFTHLTYAMDRKNIDRVFIDIHCVVISNNLSGCGQM
eukprot:680995_1